MKYLMAVVLVLSGFILFGNPVGAFTLGDELLQMFSEVDGIVTLGEPVQIGDHSLIPVVRWRVFAAGSAPQRDLSWQAGGVEIEPLALVVYRDGLFQIFHLSMGKISPGLEYLPREDLPFEELLQSGMDALQTGNLDQARIVFESLVHIQPGSADAQALLGEVYSRLADQSQELPEKIRFGIDAFRKFARALEIDPKHPRALMARGYARMYVPPPLGGIDLAIEDFRMALEQEPEMVLALTGLGEAYLSLGERELARDYFERALALEPDNQQALRGLNTLEEGGNS